MVLYERQCRLRALHDVLHLPAALVHDGLAVHIQIVASLRQVGGAVLRRLHLHFLPDYYVIVETYGQSHDEAEHDLENQLAPFAHAFLVMLEDLDVVVCESDSAAPESGEYQQLRINIGQVAEEQCRYADGKQDDDSSHCRSAFLLHLPLQSEVADCLADLLFLEPMDDLASCEERNQHGCHARKHCPERQIAH